MSGAYDFSNTSLVQRMRERAIVVGSLAVIHDFMDSGQIWEARQALETLMAEHGMEVPPYDAGEAQGIV